MMSAEQFMAANKAGFETFFGLGGKAFEGMEKLVELNLQTARAAYGEMAETARAALSVKDAQELIGLQAALLQPTAEKAVAYSRHVYEITSATGAEISRAAEQQLTETQKKVGAMVDAVSKNAPAGSDNAVSLYKSAVAAANNAIESVQKAAKQATDAAEANMNAFSDTAARAGKTAARAKR